MEVHQVSSHLEQKQTKDNANLKAMLLIIGIILIGANLRSPLTSVGPLIGSIQEDLGISNTIAGTLTTVPLIAFALFSPFTPRLSRRFGLERILLFALLFIATGVVFRFFQSVETLFIGTVLIGIGIAVCNVLMPSTVKERFPGNVGIMTGIYAVSMNLCAAIASGVSVPLSYKLGWHGSLSFWVILTLIAIIFWFPQVRGTKNTELPNIPKHQSVNIWKSKLAWKVTLFMGLQSFMFYTLVAWLPEILRQQGASTASAGWMLSYMQFAVIPFTFIVPILAGKMKSQRILVVVISFLFMFGALGLLFENHKLAAVSVILLGVAAGSAFSLSMIFFTLRTENSQQAADLSGMAQSVGYLLAAVGPALFGILHDLYQSWEMSITLFIVISVFILVFGLGAGKNQVVSKN